MSDMTSVPQANDAKIFRQELFIPKPDEDYKKIETDESGNIIRKNHSYYIGAYDRNSNKYVLKDKLIDSKVYVAKSTISGYGVFAKEDIKSGDIIEECPVVILDSTFTQNTDWVLNRYAFSWSCSCDICTKNGISMCFPMGNGMIYNHSDEPNAYYVQDTFFRLFRFYAFKDIKKDEEITWFYGHGYSERLRKEKTLTPLGTSPEGMALMNSIKRKKKGCGCGGNVKVWPVPREEVTSDIQPENEGSTNSNESVEPKSADQLLFRSMIVPEIILNDKV